MINPAPKTRFQERLRQLQEIANATNQKAPLGRSQVQGPGLPSWLDPEKTVFGVTTLQGKSNAVRPNARTYVLFYVA